MRSYLVTVNTKECVGNAGYDYYHRTLYGGLCARESDLGVYFQVKSFVQIIKIQKYAFTYLYLLSYLACFLSSSGSGESNTIYRNTFQNFMSATVVLLYNGLKESKAPRPGLWFVFTQTFFVITTTYHISPSKNTLGGKILNSGSSGITVAVRE